MKILILDDVLSFCNQLKEHFENLSPALKISVALDEAMALRLNDEEGPFSLMFIDFSLARARCCDKILATLYPQAKIVAISGDFPIPRVIEINEDVIYFHATISKRYESWGNKLDFKEFDEYIYSIKTGR